MEACSGAHYWAREFSQFDCEVILYAPPACENSRHQPKSRPAWCWSHCRSRALQKTSPVPHKSIEQQDINLLFEMRRLLVTERTRIVNQVHWRPHIQARSIVIPKGIYFKPYRKYSRTMKTSTMSCMLKRAAIPSVRTIFSHRRTSKMVQR